MNQAGDETNSLPNRHCWWLRRANVVFSAREGVFLISTRPPRPGQSPDEGLPRLQGEAEGGRNERRQTRSPDYEPLKHPELPGVLAQIDDDTAPPGSRQAERRIRAEARRFLTVHGELGFRSLCSDDEWSREGEPLGWILAEARTVRLVLELLAALQSGSHEDLLTALHRRWIGNFHVWPSTFAQVRVKVRYELCRDARRRGVGGTPNPSLPPGQRTLPDLAAKWYDESAWFWLAGGAAAALARYPRPSRLSETDAQALRDHAGAIVVDLIGAHAKELRSHLVWQDNHFIEWHQGDTLLGAIWLLLKNVATEGKRMGRCRECGRPFLMTDKRQRYCPPDALSEKSRCLARCQMRRQRQAERDLSPRALMKKPQARMPSARERGNPDQLH
jgi:hypothetical protein